MGKYNTKNITNFNFFIINFIFSYTPLLRKLGNKLKVHGSNIRSNLLELFNCSLIRGLERENEEKENVLI